VTLRTDCRLTVPVQAAETRTRTRLRCSAMQDPRRLSIFLQQHRARARGAPHLLGVDITTALRWARLAQRDWSAYAAPRPTGAASGAG
jgi:hypothetical protein